MTNCEDCESDRKVSYLILDMNKMNQDEKEVCENCVSDYVDNGKLFLDPEKTDLEMKNTENYRYEIHQVNEYHQ